MLYDIFILLVMLPKLCATVVDVFDLHGKFIFDLFYYLFLVKRKVVRWTAVRTFHVSDLLVYFFDGIIQF